MWRNVLTLHREATLQFALEMWCRHLTLQQKPSHSSSRSDVTALLFTRGETSHSQFEPKKKYSILSLLMWHHLVTPWIWRHLITLYQGCDVTSSIFTLEASSSHRSLLGIWRHLITIYLGCDVVSSLFTNDKTSTHHCLPRIWRHVITLYQGYDVTSSLFSRDVTSSHHSLLGMGRHPITL
jgi:hypothetical protein